MPLLRRLGSPAQLQAWLAAQQQQHRIAQLAGCIAAAPARPAAAPRPVLPRPPPAAPEAVAASAAPADPRVAAAAPAATVGVAASSGSSGRRGKGSSSEGLPPPQLPLKRPREEHGEASVRPAKQQQQQQRQVLSPIANSPLAAAAAALPRELPAGGIWDAMPLLESLLSGHCECTPAKASAWRCHTLVAPLQLPNGAHSFVWSSPPPACPSVPPPVPPQITQFVLLLTSGGEARQRAVYSLLANCLRAGAAGQARDLVLTLR